MFKFLVSIFLYPYYRFMLARIESEVPKEFERRMAIFKRNLIHNTSVSEDELEVRCLQEAERLSIEMRIESKQKIADLLKH